MKVTRRDAIRLSGATLAGLSMSPLVTKSLLSQAQQQQDWPDELVEMPLRDRVFLPLNADGSAPEHSPSEAGEISGVLWRYTGGETPETEFDYRSMKVRVDPRGMASRGGTLTFEDLEPLPRHSGVFLLQCGVPEPTGIAKWTGVRFSDVAEMLGVQPHAHYCRFVGSDRYYIDEEVAELMHPQVMLAWLLNDEPIPPEHGAPLRLIMPFRYGARWIKAVTEIHFGSPGLPSQPLPA
jgi:DMSO/TMAO reductase YedYZ molybdopterin-dependent catalytic subunit